VDCSRDPCYLRHADLEVDEIRSVMVVKRSVEHGSVLIDIELYTDTKVGSTSLT